MCKDSLPASSRETGRKIRLVWRLIIAEAYLQRALNPIETKGKNPTANVTHVAVNSQDIILGG